MDALMDFALVDVTSETTGETPLAPNSQQNQSTATAPLNNQDEMAANHAKLVEDLTLVVEQSLGKFENRLVTRVASEVTQHQQQQQSQSSTPRNAGNGAQSQFGQSPLPLPVHQNVYCDNCNTVIVGVRYKCGMCKDYDLCERCESSRPHQQRNHLFIKIYEPISASLNARPLISNPELARGGDGGNGISAHNPFAGFLSSLGVPAGVHATLEVVHEEEFEIEIRELAQANGCQFYLSDNGQRLCKDYQLINRSSRNIQSGDYYLEHVFSCGLMPLEIHLAVPPIPEGDIRIICLSWRAPQSAVEQSALLLGSDSVAEQDSSNNANDTTNRPPLRQVYSVYRLKDRRGRHIGEPINASLTLMQLAQTAGSWSSGVTSAAQTEADYHHWQHRRVGSNVDDSDENSFELISDDELPSCFVLDSRAPLTPPPVAPTLVPADSAPAQPNNGFDNSNFEDCLVDLTSSFSLDDDDNRAQNLLPPPLPPRISSAAVSQQQPQQQQHQHQQQQRDQPQQQQHQQQQREQPQQQQQQQQREQPQQQQHQQQQREQPQQQQQQQQREQPQQQQREQPQQQQQQQQQSSVASSASIKSTSATFDASNQSVAARLLSQSLSDRVHPSMLLAAAYVPKTSNWVPPPQQQQQQPPQPQQKPLPPPPPAPRLLQQQGSLSNLTSSDSSSDIWGPRGEQSERLQLQKLLEMGFYRKEINAKVLREANGDFEEALNRLSRMYEDF
ncbi:hypothetical protein BOX15_Mlig012059g2 [Macrostomum lignano]|uniref:ZZ-type domain-containing protein n=1 Tax=Macrostomum lignano TaxID=282301 RepID=A0A267GXA6_9PLAT|nr:hypothetical protein BOX15_Mlig012059g2 [Macrostomum lignano]